MFFSYRESLTLTKRLWLRLFSHPDICMYSYFNENSRKAYLPDLIKQDFKCQFPFFWVVMDLIDSEWEYASSEVGE